jgi:hypothetical protein
MTMLIRTIAAVVASTAITTSALAQSASDIRRPAPPVSFQNAPVGKPIGQPVEDAQQQARDLLTGVVKRPATKEQTSPSLGVGKYREPNLDPQEQARRLISGTSPLSVGATPTMAPTFAGQLTRNPRTYSDPQESARRMILGARAADTTIQKRLISTALREEAQR